MTSDLAHARAQERSSRRRAGRLAVDDELRDKHLAAIAQRLNSRPRKGLRWWTPAEVLASHLLC